MAKILIQLDVETEGGRIGNHKISTLAFVDDTVLLAKNKLEGQKQVNILHSYLAQRGMELAAHKCQAFEIILTRKSWYTRNPQLLVGEVPIKGTEPNEVMRYLGAKITVWVGLTKGSEAPTVLQAIRNLRKFNLKPWQKLEIIKIFLILGTYLA